MANNEEQYCACCGKKLGSYGNRKLANGMICKNCFYKFESFVDECNIGLPSTTYKDLSTQYDIWNKEKEAKDKTNSKKLLKIVGVIVLVFAILAVIMSFLNVNNSSTLSTSIDFCYGYEEADYSKYATISASDKYTNIPIWIEGKLVEYFPYEDGNFTYYISVVEDKNGDEWLALLDTREALDENTVEDTLKRYEKLWDKYVIICGLYNGYSESNREPALNTVKIYDESSEETLITGWGKIRNVSPEYNENYALEMLQQLMNKQKDSSNTETLDTDYVYYSSNLKDTVKNGNSGIYSYRDIGPYAHVYWLIDFDEGYIYHFTDDKNNKETNKFKIESGTLNNRVTISYQLNGSFVNEYFYFGHTKQYDCLVYQDKTGVSYSFAPTSLVEAQELLDAKMTINEY